MREQFCDEDHPETASSLILFRNVYRQQERYADALPVALRAQTICRDRLGPKHTSTLDSDEVVAYLRKKVATYGQSKIGASIPSGKAVSASSPAKSPASAAP